MGFARNKASQGNHGNNTVNQQQSTKKGGQDAALQPRDRSYHTDGTSKTKQTKTKKVEGIWCHKDNHATTKTTAKITKIVTTR